MRTNYKKTFFKENYNFHHFKGKCTIFPAQRKLFSSCAQVHHPEKIHKIINIKIVLQMDTSISVRIINRHQRKREEEEENMFLACVLNSCCSFPLLPYKKYILKDILCSNLNNN